jgi:hypothetical protein
MTPFGTNDIPKNTTPYLLMLAFAEASDRGKCRINRMVQNLAEVLGGNGIRKPFAMNSIQPRSVAGAE